MSDDISLQSKRNNSRLFIIAGVVGLCIVGLLFYFLYWVKTPAYSLNLIREAVEKHDLIKFEKHVDTESLYNRAFDDIVQKSLSESGYENNQLVMGLVGMIKKTAVDEMISQTKKYVETGDFETTEKNTATKQTNKPDGKSMAANMNKNVGVSYMQFKGIENTQKDGKIAVVTTKVYDKKLEKDFNIKLKMRELENGEWKVVEVSNLAEYYDERKNAVEAKLDALNKPIQEKIEKSIQIIGTEVNAVNENSFFPMHRLHYLVKFKLPQADNKIKNFKGIFLISDNQGKDLYGTRFNGNQVLNLYNQNDYTPEKIFNLKFKTASTLNPFIPNEDKIIKQGVNSFKHQFKIYKIEYENGNVTEILTEIPDPK